MKLSYFKNLYLLFCGIFITLTSTLSAGATADFTPAEKKKYREQTERRQAEEKAKKEKEQEQKNETQSFLL